MAKGKTKGKTKGRGGVRIPGKTSLKFKAPKTPQAQLLFRTGRAAFGSGWQKPLTQKLGITIRFLHRAVEDPPKAHLRPEHHKVMIDLLKGREAEIAATRKWLRTQPAPEGVRA